jgi:arabinogalactan endo-1,4-beta-galactosidase
MIEINALVMNRSFNNGYIFFEDKRKAKDWIRILKQYRVSYVNFIIIFNKTKYYGIRMFRMKRQFLDLCGKLKEVLE